MADLGGSDRRLTTITEIVNGWRRYPMVDLRGRYRRQAAMLEMVNCWLTQEPLSYG